MNLRDLRQLGLSHLFIPQDLRVVELINHKVAAMCPGKIVEAFAPGAMRRYFSRAGCFAVLSERVVIMPEEKRSRPAVIVVRGASVEERERSHRKPFKGDASRGQQVHLS